MKADYPDYPHPISNNAVTAAGTPGQPRTVYSFMGIVDPTDTDTITPAAYALEPGAAGWRRIADVPLDEGRARIAASAVTIRGRVFVVGGYSVLDDGTERTDPRLLEYVIADDRWVEHAPPPVEVDDTLALVRADRWLYLVSGWHGPAHDNVLDVQVWDIETDTWRACTPLPGPSTGLFGHAGGIAGDLIVVADGVMRDPETRGFVISDAVYEGWIDHDDPTVIEWIEREPHAGMPTYRAACVPDDGAVGSAIVIFGGTSTPYNIDGIGYDGVPAAALDQALNIGGSDYARTIRIGRTPPLMDLRGLAHVDGPKVRTPPGRIPSELVPDRFLIVGGMTAPGVAASEIRSIEVAFPSEPSP